MSDTANLDELNPTPKMIDDLLVTLRLPPLNGQIVLATRCNNPKRCVLSGDFVDLRVPGFFLAGKMNIAFESSGLDGKMKTLVEKLNETVKAVVRRQVAAINQRVGTIYCFGLGLVVGQPRNVRVVLPKGGA
ncbi:MAG TPA: hypothetical protein VF938_02870 [Candidatus Angelobacter sp.]